MKTFEDYLIMIGIRNMDYGEAQFGEAQFEDQVLFDNKEYFEKCFNDDLSAYKALLFLSLELNKKENE